MKKKQFKMLVKFSLILVADTKIIFHNSFVEVASLIYWNLYLVDMEEAVAQTCSVKKVSLEISQNSQENTCARVCQRHRLQLY